MAADYEMTLHDYLEIVKRRALLMLGVFAAVFIVALMVAILLPPVYQSSGTILIESQQISKEFISTSVTGYASERIEVIKQRVMTRENLLRIIEKYGLFKEKGESRVTSELIDDLRRRIQINFLSTDLGGRRGGTATIAFNIAFDYENPQYAYKVTNELVTLFLDENIKSRVERATETTEFLSQEARRLKNDLEKMETIVASYKQEHADSLPEHLGLRMDMLQRTEGQLENLNREFKSTENELRRLDLELTAVKQGTIIGGNQLSELDQLKAEYKRASVIYKETHPTVRAIKRKIDDLEKANASAAVDEQESPQVDSVLVAKLNTLIATTRARLASIQQQREELKAKISQLEQQIIKTPQVELGLSTLMRDHGNAKNKYEEILSKQLSAQIAENLEGENKSERFTLIDPPLLADKPIKPNRTKIILLGLMLAFSAAGGLAFLLEMLNQRIRGRGALTSLVGSAPLVDIPYIVTSDEHSRNKRLIIKLAIVAVLLFIVSSILVHFFYMHLDLIFYKILNRLG